MARSGSAVAMTSAARRSARMTIRSKASSRYFRWAIARRSLFRATLRHAAMESMVDDHEQRAHRRGKQNDQERDRHDQLDVLQADGGHQQIAEAALRAEHFAEQRTDQRQCKTQANAGKDFRQRGGQQDRQRNL